MKSTVTRLVLCFFCCLWLAIPAWSQFNNSIVGWVKPDVKYYYKIKFVHSSDFFITIAGGRAQNGANIHIYPDQNMESQLFQFKRVSGGYYEIASKLDPKMVLDVKGGSTENGTNLQLYRRKRTQSQRFKIGRNYKGEVFLVSALNRNKVIEAKKPSGTQLASNAYLQSLDYEIEQRFKLEKTRQLTDQELKLVQETLTSLHSWKLQPLHNTKYNIVNVPPGTGMWAKKGESGYMGFERIRGDQYRIKTGKSICIGVDRTALNEQGCSSSSRQKYRLKFYEYKGDLFVEIGSVYKPGFVWDVPEVAYKGSAATSDKKRLWLREGKRTDTQLFKLDGPYPSRSWQCPDCKVGEDINVQSN